MAPFVVPADSLSRRYAQSHRRFTWKKIRTAQGVKVLPPILNQIGRTCIYVALVGWLESHLRLIGIVIRLSWKDLQEKEQDLMTEEIDRTTRCFEVLTTMGIRSEYDYTKKNFNGIVYVVTAYERFYSLNKQAIQGAVQAMERGPLLLVFNCDQSYFQYLGEYHSKSILSYGKYNHEEMLTHAVNAVGYGVEGIVPGWEFMNSYGKQGQNKGFGRVLPQNAVRLIALTGIEVVYPRDRTNPKRKREFTDDDEEVNRWPKKMKN